MSGTRSFTVCGVKDCTDRSGGTCFSNLTDGQVEAVREMRAIRKVYDDMELEEPIDHFEKPPRPFVTWRGWKMVRNVITDRLEEITGSRV